MTDDTPTYTCPSCDAAVSLRHLPSGLGLPTVWCEVCECSMEFEGVKTND